MLFVSLVALKADLAQLYMKAGLKGIGTVFLLTDAQVPDEKFLVLINDLLASGEIPELFGADELEVIISGIRNEVKGAGIMDSRENCWTYFIDKVRKQLKVVLIMVLRLLRHCCSMPSDSYVMYVNRLFCVFPLLELF